VKSAPKQDDVKSNQKQKKKKEKPKPMSLEQFQQDGVEKPSAETNGAGDGFEDIPAEPDPKFFKSVDDDVHKIIRKEQIQEEYKKQYIAENAQTQHYKEKIRQRDEEIEKLRKCNEQLESELKEVKQRNQHLCMILGQGEMKQKASVVMELDELQQVRDELTQEVTHLNTELEKERSKVHALQSATDKHDKSKSGKRK
jgi:chromosome segregation ATPase